MKASQVRPGWLLRVDGVWRLVTCKTTARTRPPRVLFDLAETPPGIIGRPTVAGLDTRAEVEATHLTGPQVEAVRVVAAGGVFRSCDSEGQNHCWGHDDGVSRRWEPFDRAWEVDLIRPVDINRLWRVGFEPTDLGLGVLAMHGTAVSRAR